MHPLATRPRAPALAGLLFAGAALVGCGGGDDGPAAAGSAPVVLASDGFTQGTGKWKVEQQDAAGTVSMADGVLDLVAPSGATLWFEQAFSGDYEIRFSATPIPITAGGFTDRVSDLNVFWNATAPTGADPDPTAQGFDGALASYDPLHLYYVGFGANGGTTTRLRRYDGTAARPEITGYADPSAATADDAAGPMTAATRLVANAPTRVRIVSRAATADDARTLEWYANDALVFAYADPAPYDHGWFALRTTTSHFQVRDFSVVRR